MKNIEYTTQSNKESLQKLFKKALISTTLFLLLKDNLIGCFNNEYNKIVNKEEPKTSIYENDRLEEFYRTSTYDGEDILVRVDSFRCPSDDNNPKEYKRINYNFTSELLKNEWNGSLNLSFGNQNLTLDNHLVVHIELSYPKPLMIEHNFEDLIFVQDNNFKVKIPYYPTNSGRNLDLKPLDYRTYESEYKDIIGNYNLGEKNCF